jgi:hypothetical protein
VQLCPCFPNILNGIEVSRVERFQDLCETLQYIIRRIFLLERHEGPGAPTIFRGCYTLATDAGGIPALRVHRQLLFDANLMLPQVPEVILAEEALAEAEMKVRKPDLARVIENHTPPGCGTP